MSVGSYRRRRVILFIISCLVLYAAVFTNIPPKADLVLRNKPTTALIQTDLATDVLNKLEIKDHDSKNDYARERFGADWLSTGGCDTRNIILNRDLVDIVINDKCQVVSGKMADPYTGRVIEFKRGADTSGDIQIDHVVALSNAWQTGAQQLMADQRIKLANDPLELLAVDGKSNMDKSDGDAATWLPPNKYFRCQYVSRQIAVKQKYNLWVTQSEHDAILSVLNNCPDQLLPSP